MAKITDQIWGLARDLHPVKSLEQGGSIGANIFSNAKGSHFFAPMRRWSLRIAHMANLLEKGAKTECQIEEKMFLATKNYKQGRAFRCSNLFPWPHWASAHLIYLISVKMLCFLIHLKLFLSYLTISSKLPNHFP
jgi:hypothetical protein